MRDPNRRTRILLLLKTIWDKYPDLRLFQMLENVFPCKESHYYVEDDVLEKELSELYLTNERPYDKIKKKLSRESDRKKSKK